MARAATPPFSFFFFFFLWGTPGSSLCMFAMIQCPVRGGWNCSARFCEQAGAVEQKPGVHSGDFAIRRIRARLDFGQEKKTFQKGRFERGNHSFNLRVGTVHLVRPLVPLGLGSTQVATPAPVQSGTFIAGRRYGGPKNVIPKPAQRKALQQASTKGRDENGTFHGLDRSELQTGTTDKRRWQTPLLRRY